jgi:cytochrome c
VIVRDQRCSPPPPLRRAARILALLAAMTLFAVAAPAAEPGPGEAMLQRCQICHTFTEGGPSKVGPNLHGVLGRKAGIAPGFSFSEAMKNSGIVWDDETLAKFLRDPKASVPGNRMSFPGIADEAALADLLARLQQATQ